MPGAPADLGLTGAQLANARAIVAEGKRRGATAAQIDVALMTALTESSLQNYANSSIPDSLALPHEAVGNDHASVGVFQQQVGIWGAAPELMNVQHSAGLFFDALFKAGPVDTAAPWLTAQKVQRSAFSDGSNYRTHWAAAQQIRAGLDSGSGEGDFSHGEAGTFGPATGLAALGNAAAAAGKIGAAFSSPDFWRRIGLGALGAVLLLIAAWMILNETGAVAAGVKLAKKVVL